MTVTPVDANATYDGESGITGANGTVVFPLPKNVTNVTITAMVDDMSTTIDQTLHAAVEADDEDVLVWNRNGPFGRWLSSLLQHLVEINTDNHSARLFPSS